MNYMEQCNSGFLKGPIVCASFLSYSHVLVDKTKVKTECEQILFALCNRHERDGSQMKGKKGKQKDMQPCS